MVCLFYMVCRLKGQIHVMSRGQCLILIPTSLGFYFVTLFGYLFLWHSSFGVIADEELSSLAGRSFGLLTEFFKSASPNFACFWLGSLLTGLVGKKFVGVEPILSISYRPAKRVISLLCEKNFGLLLN